MPIGLGELWVYGSAVMPDDDSTLNIGGAIATSKTVEFIDASGTLQGVSSAAGDTTQSVTVTYRDTAGIIQTLVIALNGTTPVTNAAVTERLLKAVKSATTTGDVAVETQTAERTGTAQVGSTSTSIILDSGASAVDDAYRGRIVRLTGGTGSAQIRRVVKYVGTTKVATVDRAWSVTPDGTTTFRLSKGIYFAKSPVEVTEVRRPFYNAAGSTSTAKTYYEKVFVKNTHATLTLTTAEVQEVSDPDGFIDFALETTLNGTGTNGAGNNRQVAPSAGVGAFSSAAKPVTTGSLIAGDTQGVWLRLSLPISVVADNIDYVPALAGVTA